MHETPRLLPGGVFYISVFPDTVTHGKTTFSWGNPWEGGKINRLVLVGFESSLSILEGSS